MNDLIGAVAAFKAIDHCVTSADARLSYRSNSEHLSYLRERDAQLHKDNEELWAMQSWDSERARMFDSEEAAKFRMHESDEAEYDREHQIEMQRREHRMRRLEIDTQERMQDQVLRVNAQIAAYQTAVAKRSADRDREARLAMHARELDQNEQLEVRRLRVQEKLASRNEDLQKYLSEQGIKSTQEIERFKALAMRETQILMARENAQNMLQDHLVQEALRNFPLNISPIVLLRKQPHSLTGLLRFSSQLPASVLPSISQVYEDVKAYSKNPEALNIFIAPIYIDSKIQNREGLSQQIWDSIYQNVESFFTLNYNRRGDHPVILYPTAWKDKTSAGQHTSETLHFFLKDIPCLVLEPRFDGNSFSLMLSSWGIGYTSTDHIRTEMKFKMNLDTLLIKSAYERSLKSIKILDELGDNVSDLLSDKRKQLEQNIKYYEMLNLGERFNQGSIDEISAIGAYNLFHIDPVQDMDAATQMISSLICLNLAILSDVHHLQGTDAAPLFPSLFKSSLEELYADIGLRDMVAKCYERIYLYLRNEDSMIVESGQKREMERVREMQLTNLYKTLELIDEVQLNESIEEKLRKYYSDKFGEEIKDIDELWRQSIEKMTIEDVPFFKELLPNIDERRRYKQIDKRISELQRQL